MAERTARSRDWLQISSNIVIILGLGLVVYELNQSKQLAHAQFVNSDIARMTSVQIALMGEDPRESLARAELHPRELTVRDAVALDALYRTVTMGWANFSRTDDIAGLDRNFKGIIATEARRYFTSEPGRRWLAAWASGRQNWQPVKQVIEVVREATNDESGESLRSSYERLLADQSASDGV